MGLNLISGSLAPARLGMRVFFIVEIPRAVSSKP